MKKLHDRFLIACHIPFATQVAGINTLKIAGDGCSVTEKRSCFYYPSKLLNRRPQLFSFTFLVVYF